MINNRQAGRRRGRGGQQQQRSQGNPGRPDNGNRIDNRARGNAAQLLEKYKSLARDAQMQGDRVNAEYYLQFADHYFRVLAETRSRFDENRRPNGFEGDDDLEYDDDGEPIRADEGQRGERQPYDRQQNDRPQNDRQLGERQQNDRQQGERQQSNGQQGERQGNDRQQPDRGNGYVQQGRGNGSYDENRNDARSDGRDNRPQRDGRAGNGNARDGNVRDAGARDGGNDETRPERYQRNDRDGDREAGNRERADGSGRAPRGDRAAAPRAPVYRDAPPVAEPEAARVVVDEAEAAPAPRRRGRPPRVAAPVEPADGVEPDRLPPSLGISAKVEPDGDGDGEPAEAPRRRRGRPPGSGAKPAAG